MTQSIQVKDLQKRFGTVKALAGITLRLDKGDRVLIAGPNGAGKTTLLMILATLMAPTRGAVLYDGVPCPAAIDGLAGKIGILAHAAFLYKGLTGKENLWFFGQLNQVPGLQKKIPELLDFLGLTPDQDKPVGHFSFGREKKLAIAVLLLCAPSILLLDEPFSGLDLAFVDGLTSILQSKILDDSILVLATHDLEKGLSVANRGVVLKQGLLVKEFSGNQFDSSALAKELSF